MKRKANILSLTILFFLSIPIASGFADTVITDAFQNDIDASLWTSVEQKPVVQDGLLYLKTASNNNSKYVNSGLRSNPNPAMNFTKQPIIISLDKLELNKGSASAGSQVFKLLIISDKGPQGEDRPSLQFRIDGEGVLTLKTYPASSNSDATHKNLITLHVTFPIEKLSIQLSDESTTLEVIDASGQKRSEYIWKVDDLASEEWKNSNPSLKLLATRLPGEGDSIFSIKKIEVKTLGPNDK